VRRCFGPGVGAGLFALVHDELQRAD
jgi:hypothetical protein